MLSSENSGWCSNFNTASSYHSSVLVDRLTSMLMNIYTMQLYFTVFCNYFFHSKFTESRFSVIDDAWTIQHFSLKRFDFLLQLNCLVTVHFQDGKIPDVIHHSLFFFMSSFQPGVWIFLCIHFGKKNSFGLWCCRKIQHTAQFYSNLDPAVRQILKEKEHAAMALQETVEVHRHTHTHFNLGNTSLDMSSYFHSLLEKSRSYRHFACVCAGVCARIYGTSCVSSG